MSLEARSPGGRLRSAVGPRLRSITDLALTGHTEREREILRQLTDVFAELKRLSAQVSALQAGTDEANGNLRRVIGATETGLDTQIETTQMLGRLIESARSRLEVLEEAVNGSR